MASMDPRRRVTVQGVVLPLPGDRACEWYCSAPAESVGLMRNTSWLVPGIIMGSSTPKRHEQVRAGQGMGRALAGGGAQHAQPICN